MGVHALEMQVGWQLCSFQACLLVHCVCPPFVASVSIYRRWSCLQCEVSATAIRPEYHRSKKPGVYSIRKAGKESKGKILWAFVRQAGWNVREVRKAERKAAGTS